MRAARHSNVAHVDDSTVGDSSRDAPSRDVAGDSRGAADGDRDGRDDNFRRVHHGVRRRIHDHVRDVRLNDHRHAAVHWLVARTNRRSRRQAMESESCSSFLSYPWTYGPIKNHKNQFPTFG